MLIHEALRQAGTVVCEPVERFHLEIPASALPAVTVTVGRLSGLITGTTPVGDALELTGTLPTRSLQPLLAQLPELTSGEGVLTSEVTRYAPVAGPPPVRAEERSRPPGQGGVVPRPSPLTGLTSLGREKFFSPVR